MHEYLKFIAFILLRGCRGNDIYFWWEETGVVQNMNPQLNQKSVPNVPTHHSVERYPNVMKTNTSKYQATTKKYLNHFIP